MRSENVRPPCLQHKISSVKSPADASTPQKHRAACVLLGLVLLLPALEPLLSVAPLSGGMVGAIVGLAFGSMVIIQLLKLIRR